MIVNITKAQLEAIKNLADDTYAMLGCGDNDKYWKHHIRLIDNFLSKNKLKPRDFNGVLK